MSADAFPGALLIIFAAFTVGRVRAMQYATGLMYIAMAPVLADEVLAQELLFVAAVPM